MAIFFVENAMKKKRINIFNRGNHHRDFTYIDDVVNISVKILLSKTFQK